MTNLSIINILPNRAADICIKLKSITSKLHNTSAIRVVDISIKLKSITSKLHNTSASIACIKKALFVDVIPKYVTTSHWFSVSASMQLNFLFIKLSDI